MIICLQTVEYKLSEVKLLVCFICYVIPSGKKKKHVWKDIKYTSFGVVNTFGEEW